YGRFVRSRPGPVATVCHGTLLQRLTRPRRRTSRQELATQSQDMVLLARLSTESSLLPREESPEHQAQWFASRARTFPDHSYPAPSSDSAHPLEAESSVRQRPDFPAAPDPGDSGPRSPFRCCPGRPPAQTQTPLPSILSLLSS